MVDWLHSVESTVSDAENSIAAQVSIVKELAEVASKHPYYKYNGLWTRDMQDLVSIAVQPILRFAPYSHKVFAILLCGWLGGFDGIQQEAQSLLSIESVGQILKGKALLKKSSDTLFT